jgi:LCP family protein required for cell wall assembly
VNEEELRAAFARHEAEAPDVQDLQNSIEREVRRRRARRVKTLTGGLAALVVLAIAVPVWLAQRAGVTPRTAMNVAASITGGPQKDLTLLLLGIDKRGDWPDNVSRSDTIVIVHIPADRKKIYTVSIERDVLVEIPGHPKDKINSAFYFGSQGGGGVAGGLALAEQTISKLTGAKFDGGAVLEFNSIKQITDALGGVPMCLEKPVAIYLPPSPAKDAKVIGAGCHTFPGSVALALVRQRAGLPNGSYDRDRTMQRYLVGVTQKVSELNLLTDAGKIAELMKVKGLTVDLGGISAAELATQLRGIKAADVVPLSLANTFVGGKDGEGITAEGQALLQAVGAGTLPEFAASHPQLVLRP